MATILRALPLLLVALVGAAALAQDEPVPKAERAKINATRDTMRSLAQDLRAHQQAGDGDYTKELKALVPNFREALPKDGWGRDFTYEVINRNGESDFRLASLGSDGKAGGKGAAADIVFTSAGEQRELSADEKALREKRREEARFQAGLAVARLEMAVLGGLAVDHRVAKKAWPQDLKELRKEGTDDQAKAQDRCFTDPWGHEYELKLLPHDNLAIVCRGADGKEGGKDRDADFVVTEKEVRALGGGDDYRYRGWGGGEWQIHNLADNIRKFKKERGELPKTLDELVMPGAKQGQNPIVATLPRDRFGNEYAYVVYGPEEFFLVALGKDQVQGGKGDDADVVSPQPGVFQTYYEEEMPAEITEDRDALKAEIALEQVKDIAEKVNEHKKEKGTYPESLETIKDKFPEQTVPADPWGNAYVLTLTKNDTGEGTGFVVKCLGSDGADGGEGNAGDLKINEKGEQLDKPAAPPEESPKAEPEPAK